MLCAKVKQTNKKHKSTYTVMKIINLLFTGTGIFIYKDAHTHTHTQKKDQEKKKKKKRRE